MAEKTARFFGTPAYILTQTVIVLLWILANGFILVNGFDPYPFIALNLLFSLQAAYAAPLILLAQTRQADRDKALAEADAKHREEIAQVNQRMLEQNTAITERIDRLTQEIHQSLKSNGDSSNGKTGDFGSPNQGSTP